MTTIATNNAAWVWSPFNWVFNGATYAETNNPGAYAKIGFTGTSAALLVDVSPLVSAGYASGKYPYIHYSVDGATATAYQLKSSDASLSLATGLSSGNHTLRVDFSFCDASATDRWTTPSEILRITGLTIDAAATAVAATRLGKMAAWWGDSISEAVWDDTSYATGDATKTCIPQIAAELGCEIGRIAFQAQGYTVGGVGNVPPLYTNGSAANTAWNQDFASVSRLIGGLLSPAPDYIFCWHGQNDSGVSAGTLATVVQQWVTAVRAAAGIFCKIIILIPAHQVSVTGITNGVAAYNSANPTDGRVFLINTGVDYEATPANVIADGIHLTATGQTAFATDAIPLIEAAVTAVTPVATPGTEHFSGSVNIALDSPTPDNIKFYTDDGTDPVPFNVCFPPIATPPSGSYISGQTVSLFSPNGDEIWYTDDGQDPVIPSGGSSASGGLSAMGAMSGMSGGGAN